jgi:hypothetical protein
MCKVILSGIRQSNSQSSDSDSCRVITNDVNDSYQYMYVIAHIIYNHPFIMLRGLFSYNKHFYGTDGGRAGERCLQGFGW